MQWVINWERERERERELTMPWPVLAHQPLGTWPKERKEYHSVRLAFPNITASAFLSLSTTPHLEAPPNPKEHTTPPSCSAYLSLLSCPSVAQVSRATTPTISNGPLSFPSLDQPRPLDPAHLDWPPLRCEAGDSTSRSGPSNSPPAVLTWVCSLWMHVGSPRCSFLQSWNPGRCLCWRIFRWWSKARSTVERAKKLDYWSPFSCSFFFPH